MQGQEWTGQAPGRQSLATDGEQAARKGPGSRRTFFTLFILESVGSLNMYEPNTNRLPGEQINSLCPKPPLGRVTISACMRSTRVQGQISECRDPTLRMLEAPRPMRM